MTEQDYEVDTASINMAHMNLEDKASSGGKRGNDGGRRKGGGRGGGGGGGGGQGREVQVSKALSKLLRHQAASAGIQLDDEGFAPLDRVVSLRGCNTPSYDELF
jgi:2'-phosphotransferase